MEIITNEIFRALGFLMIAGFASFVYLLAHDNTIKSGVKTILWKGFLWCAGISLFTSIMLGNPTCEQRADPAFGGCEEYLDDGYEPTTEQRVANFAYFMTLLYIPVAFGALSRKKE